MTRLEAAAAAYRAAADRYDQAAVAAITARSDGFTRAAHQANARALDARHALEHARDELVHAALAHDCEAA